MSVIVVIIDEIALYSATLGKPNQREEFDALLRDLVSRGRACAMPVLAATQRPSWDIIPASLRDLFGYRAAFRCTTTNSSNIALGQGWAEQGYTATDIPPTNHGACYLLAEGGTPHRIKVAYLCSASLKMLTSPGLSGVLGADVKGPGVAGLCVFVGGGSVPMTDTQRPSR